MRYRKLTADGDYSFGQGNANFWVDQPEAVAQAVDTRLGLQTGEWFLDVTDGLDMSLIVGKNTASTRDLTIKARILKTQAIVGGRLRNVVPELLSYASQALPDRSFDVQTSIQTIYGPSPVEVALK